MEKGIKNKQISFQPAHVCQDNIRCNTRVAFYENKIIFLQKKNLPIRLLKLVSRDAPVKAGDLTNDRQRRIYQGKCLKYYRTKISELKKGGRFLKLFFE